MSVLRQLNDMIEGWSQVPPLVPPLNDSQKSDTGKLILRISPELHKTLAIKAQLQKTSLNRYCEEQLMR
jgi:predicted HicB family RNase H-like nuclease